MEACGVSGVKGSPGVALRRQEKRTPRYRHALLNPPSPSFPWSPTNSTFQIRLHYLKRLSTSSVRFDSPGRGRREASRQGYLFCFWSWPPGSISRSIFQFSGSACGLPGFILAEEKPPEDHADRRPLQRRKALIENQPSQQDGKHRDQIDERRGLTCRYTADAKVVKSVGAQ